VGSHQLLQNNAKQEVLRNAGLMMEAGARVRGYTVSQVKPLIESQLAEKFLPQSVPAYAAHETFNTLRKKYPDFSYKEALLNPTNPRNKAVEWENDIVNNFRNTGATTRSPGSATRPWAHALHRAPDPDQGPGLPRLPQRARRRARLDDQALRREQRLRLEAHGRSSARRWSRCRCRCRSRTPTSAFMGVHELGSAGDLRGDLHACLNIWLRSSVIRPISRMSAVGGQVSTGDFDVP
jgi:protein-histidine pros-kinase